MKFEISRHIFEKYQIFMKISPERAELFHAERRTHGQIDIHNEANNHFSQFFERA